MRRSEIYKRQTRSIWWLPIGLMVLAGFAVFYWIYIYQKPSVAKQDIYNRIERRVAVFESKVASNPIDFLDHLSYIKESNLLIAQAMDRYPQNSWSYYYQSVFSLYELAIRARVDVQSLYEILSRSYLPPPRNLAAFTPPIGKIPKSNSAGGGSEESVATEEVDGESGREVPNILEKSFGPRTQKFLVELGGKLMHSARKAIAIGTNKEIKKNCQILLVIGKLFYTGQTDRKDFERIASLEDYHPPQVFLRYFFSWAQILFYSLYANTDGGDFTIAGKDGKLKITASIDQLNAPEAHAIIPETTSSLLSFEDWKKLLLGRIFFRQGNYNRALNLAHSLVSKPKGTKTEAQLAKHSAAYLHQEGNLLIAQIFYIQRSSSVALPYLEKAATSLQGSDPFVEKMLEKWSK